MSVFCLDEQVQRYKRSKDTVQNLSGVRMLVHTPVVIKSCIYHFQVVTGYPTTYPNNNNQALRVEKKHNMYRQFFFKKQTSLFVFAFACSETPINDACACQIPECKLGENQDKQSRHLSLHQKSFNQIAFFLGLFNNYV